MAAGRLPEARVSAQAGSCINQGRRVLKRILDVTTAVAALVILSPVILLTALAVWGTLGRPLLFEQVSGTARATLPDPEVPHHARRIGPRR